MKFTELMSLRRSRYALTNTLPIKEEELQHIIGQCLLYSPSAFNSQSARVVLLMGEKHRQLWQMTKECLQQVVAADKFAPTEQKLAGFAAAYGTILFYEDTETILQLQAKFPTYKDNFPVWASQANGMLQFAVWTALAEAGVGASLQHYNPLIDKHAEQAFSIPPAWHLVAQMPFGFSSEEVEAKTQIALQRRLLIRK